MIKKLRENTDIKKLFSNSLNFSLFQATNHLVPLITIPYIVRIIGPEKFGILSFAIAAILYLQIFVDYGFNLSAVQKIAVNRKSQTLINETFNAVLFIRVAILVLGLFALIASSFIFSEVKEYFNIYIFTFLMIPGIILQSLWFYNGMEKMEYLNYVNFITRILYLVGIFMIIRNESDYIYIPLINSVSLIISGIASITLIKKRFKIRIFVPDLKIIKSTLRSGWPVFAANLGINMYRNSSVFILGLFAAKEIVGFYSAAERIVKILQNIFSPITNSFYPYISRIGSSNKNRGQQITLKILLFTGILTTFISFVLFAFSDWLTINFLGNNFFGSIKILKILSFVIPFGVANYIIGIIFMLNNSMKNEFMKSVLITGLLSIISSYLLTKNWLETGTAVAFLLSEVFLLFLLVIFIWSNKEKWKTEIA